MPVYVQVCPAAFVHVAVADAPILTQVTLRLLRIGGGEPGIAKTMAARERTEKTILFTNMLTVSQGLFRMIVMVTRADAVLIVFVRQAIYGSKYEGRCAAYIQIYVRIYPLFLVDQAKLLYLTG